MSEHIHDLQEQKAYELRDAQWFKAFDEEPITLMNAALGHWGRTAQQAVDDLDDGIDAEHPTWFYNLTRLLTLYCDRPNGVVNVDTGPLVEFDQAWQARWHKRACGGRCRGVISFGSCDGCGKEWRPPEYRTDQEMRRLMATCKSVVERISEAAYLRDNELRIARIKSSKPTRKRGRPSTPAERLANMNEYDDGLEKGKWLSVEQYAFRKGVLPDTMRDRIAKAREANDPQILALKGKKKVRKRK